MTKNLFSIYNKQRIIINDLISINRRGVDLTEALSEITFCLEMNCVRVISSISGANSSWDEIYFMDFYKDGNWNGEFDIYLIENDLIYNHRVNNNQTMREQQLERRRPRFSIYKDIIKRQNIGPVFSGGLNR